MLALQNLYKKAQFVFCKLLYISCASYDLSIGTAKANKYCSTYSYVGRREDNCSPIGPDIKVGETEEEPKESSVS